MRERGTANVEGIEGGRRGTARMYCLNLLHQPTLDRKPASYHHVECDKSSACRHLSIFPEGLWLDLEGSLRRNTSTVMGLVIRQSLELERCSEADNRLGRANREPCKDLWLRVGFQEERIRLVSRHSVSNSWHQHGQRTTNLVVRSQRPRRHYEDFEDAYEILGLIYHWALLWVNWMVNIHRLPPPHK